jgi:hypothetical protein
LQPDAPHHDTAGLHRGRCRGFQRAPDSWQVKGKQRIVDHGGCGIELIREATRPNTDLLRESLTSRHSRRKNLISVHNPG